MSDPTARYLAAAALIFSVLALALVLSSLRQPHIQGPVAHEHRLISPPRPPSISNLKQPQPLQEPSPTEVTPPGAVNVRLKALERELEAVRTTVANAEKMFYVTLDQTAPDLTEEILDEEGKPRTISYGSILLSDLGPAVHEVLEVHYRYGNVWHVLAEDRWELRDGNLIVRTGYITGDQLRCRLVCR